MTATRDADAINQAIVATEAPRMVEAMRFDFTIQSSDGTLKPAAILLPASLTLDDALTGLLPAVINAADKVISEQSRPKSPLVLVKGQLPPIART